MPDLRTSTALRKLTDLGPKPDPPDWTWAITPLEPSGRLRTEACGALGASLGARATVRGVCHRTVLVLRPAGGGRPLTIDGRGRLYVPVGCAEVTTLAWSWVRSRPPRSSWSP